MDMTIIEKLNSAPMYLICGAIVAFVAVVCAVFILRAWRAGVALGISKERMRRVVTASATFSLLPSVGILLGVIALSGSLGTPWPWLRLSVIGALHYETQVAQAAAEQLGLQLSAEAMTAGGFSTIALLMSVCIMWGMILMSVFGRRYLLKLGGSGAVKPAARSGHGFGDVAMTAMFVGMVGAYLGSYIGAFISGNGVFSFRGTWTPLAVSLAAAAAMAVFTWLIEKKHLEWLEGFSVAGSMLLGMLTAVLIGG